MRSDMRDTRAAPGCSELTNTVHNHNREKPFFSEFSTALR